MIDAEICCNLRFERGLSLPVNGEYSLPRLKEIAIEMHDLLHRLAILDGQLLTIAGKDYAEFD